MIHLPSNTTKKIVTLHYPNNNTQHLMFIQHLYLSESKTITLFVGNYKQMIKPIFFCIAQNKIYKTNHTLAAFSLV